MVSQNIFIKVHELTFIVGATTLDQVTVSSLPSIVGEALATLEVVVLLKTTIPTNGIIQIEVPAETTLTSGSHICSIGGDVTISSLTCTAAG